MKYKRIFTIVIDSLGIGETSDSHEYGDVGVNTLEHIATSREIFNIPNLEKLGIGYLVRPGIIARPEKPLASYMKLRPISKGKDTLTGHWEMMGVNVQKPFKTFTETGFPQELIELLEEKTGKKIIGNKSSSGTEILDELALEEIENDKLIVYTSSDSVLQICGNEETMGLTSLYRYCEIARELTMLDEWKVGRVIARPYTGKAKGEFSRTSNRHDYALKPEHSTYLNALKDSNFDVIAVGKINDIFVGQGITQSYKSKSSVHGMEQTIQIAQTDFTGLCYVNLVDFDALWGHRRDPIGYGNELEKFDEKLGQLLTKLQKDDLLIVTADHGNDPTYKGTDHTREKVPMIAYSPSNENGKNIGEGNSFAVVGKTIAENFKIKSPKETIGFSVLNKI
ncbi:MAG: phosphopentomutase [Clostridia bacterium]